MKIAPVADVKSKFSAYLKESQKGPVIVTKNGTPVAAILAITDEQQLLRLLLDYAPKFAVDLTRILKSRGLVTALELLKEEITATNHIAIHLEIDKPTADRLSQSAQEVLLSLVVEAVTNTANHAQANHLYIRLYQREQHALVEVEDDGIGFDVASVEADQPDAKVYVDQRAAIINGETTIQSAPGEGTKVTLSIPVEGA